MRRPQILTLLACALLSLISTQARAQTDDAVTELLSLHSQCNEFRSAGKYDEAIEPCQRALDIVVKLFGSKHPNVAAFKINLALVYKTKGDYAKAEPLYQDVLDIYEKANDIKNPNFAAVLNNFAELYEAKGDHAKAEQLFLRAVPIFEEVFGREHLNVATILNNLAKLYEAKREYAKAKPLFQRALTIGEKALGSEYPDVATSLTVAALLNNFALLYLDQGDYVQAEPLYQRALRIREKVFGDEHPLVAESLNNLAMLYQLKGEYAEAEPLYQRALAINEKAFGGEHPLVADCLNNLSSLYEAKGAYPRAIELLTRGQEIRESNVNAILSTGSERQKQAYLDTIKGETDSTVSLHAYSAPANMQAARLALTTILRRKGRALDMMTDQIAGLRRRAAPDDVKLLDALAATQSQLATFQLSNDAQMSPTKREMHVAELETQIEKLQNDIGRRNAEFRARTEAVTLDAVRAAIPADAALVEIFAYQSFNAKAKSRAERFGKARYVAYVLKPTDDAPQFVDLGEAAPIDSDLKLWREALLNPARTDVRQLGRRVDERFMHPVRKLLGDTKRLFISPDGALNLIPFAALVDENNKYLLETYSLDYLTSGRDLLRLQVRSENHTGAVIFANPTYNLTGQTVAACEDRKPQRGLRLSTTDANATNGKDKEAAVVHDISFSGIDFTKSCYPPLKGTAEEATRINATLTNVTILTDRGATEAALKALNSPPILHVATHGFFLPDQLQTLNKDAALGAGASSNENPLLRSGLIMAGANQRSSGAGEDGVLTAAEAAGLNLWGTKLVVLSACETGLGEAVNGAGVYGLRRALVLAGSETQVMSLWKVDDAATRDLMVDYYTRLQRGEGRTEAMQQAQLSMLRGKTQNRTKGTRGLRSTSVTSISRAHPYYWAAFITSGDWRSMNRSKQ